MAAPLPDNIQPLLRRLRNSRRTEQLQAATELAALVQASSPEQRTALVVAGCVQALVQLLRSNSSAMQAAAARALAALTSEGVNSAALAAVSDGGGVAALVPLLGSSSEAVQENAARVLANLAHSGNEAAAAMEAAGGAPILVRLLSSSNDKVQQAAAYAVCNLSSKAPVRAALASAGAFPALLPLLGDGRASARAQRARMAAVTALGNLALQSAERKAAAVAAGVPAALVQALRSGPDADVHEAAAGAIRTLAEDSDSSPCAALADAGAIEALAERLSDSSSAACYKQACYALSWLARDSPERCGALIATGCTPRLVQLLGGGGAEVQAAAADALCHLSCVVSTAASSPAIVAAGGLPQLVAVLQSGNDSTVLEFAAVTLNNLARDGFAEAAMAAGAVPALQQLQQSPNEAVREASSAALAILSAALDSSSAAPPPAAQPADDAAAAAEPTSRQRPPRVCASPGCGATTGLRRCGGCGSVRYCGEACSRAHWRAHKAECRRLQAERALAAQR